MRAVRQVSYACAKVAPSLRAAALCRALQGGYEAPRATVREEEVVAVVGEETAWQRPIAV